MIRVQLGGVKLEKKVCLNICFMDQWKFGRSKVLTNKLLMVFRTFFFFNSDKFFFMQFGLTKMYSIVEEMVHSWCVLLKPWQRKGSRWGFFPPSNLWQIAMSNFWEEKSGLKQREAKQQWASYWWLWHSSK